MHHHPHPLVRTVTNPARGTRTSSGPTKPASGPIPKFVSVRGTFRYELRNQRTTSNFMILVRFEFEVPMTIVPQHLIGTSNSPHWRGAIGACCFAFAHS